MVKMSEIIKNRQNKLSTEEQEGVKSRLIFAGIEMSDEVEASTADTLLDRLVEKMRYSKKELVEYAEKTSTIPRQPMQNTKGLLVSLVNGRLATFDSSNNVVMPVKKTPTK